MTTVRTGTTMTTVTTWTTGTRGTELTTVTKVTIWTTETGGTTLTTLTTGTTVATVATVTTLTTGTTGTIASSETQGQSVGSGENGRRKFSSKGGRAPGYRLSPDHFQKFKRYPSGTQGLFRPYLKTFVAHFLPTRLTAPGSPRMGQSGQQ